MRVVTAALAALCLSAPAVVRAQAFEVHGSAGPTLTDAGYLLSAGVGFTPMSRLTIIVDVAQTRLATRVDTDLRGNVTTSRGGTVTLGEAALRVSLFGTERIDPYAIAGIGMGVTRPNSIAGLADRGTIDVLAPFAGGGILVPFRHRVSFFCDGRMMLVAGTETDELLGVGSIRGGINWRF